MKPPKIEVKNFCKSFGDKTIHSDVSFELREGECLGLLGGSGTGKSVLLRSMIGLEKPTSGSILVDGVDVTKLSEHDLFAVRKKVAYVFQGGALFDSMSVFENLAYPLLEHTQMTDHEIKDRVMSLLADFGLDGSSELLPADLSGGMQKRVGLARSIIMKPDVILYDEPTAGLDPANTKKIEDLILRLKSTGTTSVLVTHDMPVAFKVCDRIGLLQGGKLKAIGTIAEIEKYEGNPISQFATGDY